MARIVIADDELDLVEILADILQAEGHEIRTAVDGVGALCSVRAWRPDAIILDLDMPGMSGRAVVHELRGEGAALARTPVVLLSGNANVDRIAAEIGVGFAVTKPVLIDDLLAVIGRALCAAQAPPESADSPKTFAKR